MIFLNKKVFWFYPFTLQLLCTFLCPSTYQITSYLQMELNTNCATKPKGLSAQLRRCHDGRIWRKMVRITVPLENLDLLGIDTHEQVYESCRINLNCRPTDFLFGALVHLTSYCLSNQLRA